MKKLLALMLALTMVFCLAACGGSDLAHDRNGGHELSGNLGHYGDRIYHILLPRKMA